MRRHSTFGLALVAALSLFACRGDDDDANNTNHNTNTQTGHTVFQVQDPAHAQHVMAGSTVRLEQVVVTAVDTYGERTGNLWVSEPEGGPYSGVQVFGATIQGGTIADVHVGDLVTVVGDIDEFALDTDTSGRTTTEIVNALVTVLGTGTPVQPVVVTAAELANDPSAERYEGVLVTLADALVTGKNDQYQELTVVGGLRLDNELMDVMTGYEVGDCLTSVTGVHNYFFNYFLMPRSAADIVKGAATDCPALVPEICDDGIDNDGDGFTDCADRDCGTEPGCKETNCTDGTDNDGDGFADCDDWDCQGTAACPVPVENSDALCDDGEDNDEDGLTDCDDPSCKNHPDVTVCTIGTPETVCDDGIDNDGDGFTDCDDWDCDGAPGCSETNCFDEIDDDDNGFTDCEDFACLYSGVCPDTETTDETCSDGIDQDGNTFIDCRDFSCQKAPDVTVCEGNARTCSDGLDNDGNGFTDCADFACRYCQGASPRSVSTCPPCPE
jgi:hypothetical protein